MKNLEIKDEASFEAVAGLACRAASTAANEALNERTEAVRGIVEAVRQRGDAAVAEFTQEFDAVALRPEQFELSPSEIDAAVAEVDPALVAILERARENIRRFHAAHLRESWEEEDADGTVLGQRITPLERVGVYVPGGKAFYPSSVLMNIVPAAVAGVKDIIMVSPPSYKGSVLPAVLAAARVAGATRVFRIGGAQSVAALAYGTEHVPSVPKIVGPGNIYVTLAKRLVSTTCAIDMEAGPSEVVVIADDKAEARFVAAEMLAQAEHDEDARAILVTPDGALAEKVAAEIASQAALLSRTRIIQHALDANGMIITVRDMDDAIRLTNQIAPEHLSIQTEYPRAVFDRIANAGAAMLGTMTPVAVGDYYAGPNHVLPTGGRARFASPLSAEDFRKVTSVLSYSRERLKKDADDIRRLAETEGLTAHAKAVEIRT